MCGILWADYYWVMSHSKGHLEHLMKALIEDSGSSWQIKRKCGKRLQQGHHAWWRDAHILKQIRAVEDEMQADCGASLQRFQFPLRKLVVASD